MSKKKSNFSKLTGIRFRLLTILLVICIFPVLSLGIISYEKSYKILSNKLTITSEETLTIVNKTIDNYFAGFINTINMLSANVDFQQLEIHPEFQPYAMGLLKDVQTSNKDLMNVYFGQASKKMNIYPEQKLPDGYDPTSRPWYKKAMSNKGEIVFSDPYADASTGEVVISISKTVEFNGQVVGVISADISLKTLAAQLSDIKVGSTGYAYIADSTGSIIAHPDKSILGKKVQNLISIWDEVSSKPSGFTSYYYNGEKKFSSYTTNPSTGWKLISAINEQELKADTDSIQNLTLIFILGIALISIFISLVVSKSITKHVYNLKDVFQKASEGDLTIRVNIKSKDEFLDLGNSFNHMLDEINHLIDNVKHSATILKETATSINSSASETARAINEVSLTIDQVAQGATSQSQDISEGVDSVNSLAQKIELIGNLSTEMNNVSNNTSVLSQEGLKIMEILTSKTAEANTTTIEVSNVIEDMDKSTSQISLITDTINSIAEQTNLLALNAAIEAARAGESGRGFSVVADEIRKLAEQSTNATKQIQELIEQIKLKSQLAVSSVHSAKSVVNEQTTAVNETRDIFNKIIDSIKILISEIHETQASITQTNENKEDIVSRIQNISAVAEENSASTEEVSSATQEISAIMTEFTTSAAELSELALRLEAEINKFKLS